MLIFVHSYLPVGGAEVLRKTVVTEMAKGNFNLRLCLIGGGGDVATDLKKIGVPVDELGLSSSIYNPLTTLTLAKHFKKHQPTIVQSSQFNSNFHTRIAAKLAGVPVVICEEHGVNLWKGRWHRLVDRFLASWCDKIIAVSQAVKDFNTREIGIPAEKVEVLHNCFDADRSEFVRSRDDVRSEFGLEKGDFVIGHVGTLRKEKGHDILLKAFQKFSSIQSAKLLLVGDGPLKEQLQEQVGTLCLTNDVIFAGSRSDVPDLLKAMDLFVFPSRNEALGIALLEAMYSALPVIAARTGGIPEIVEDGETGLLVESEDVDGFCLALQRLFADPSFCRSLGQKAMDYAKRKHSPQAYVEKLLLIHDQLLAEKGVL